MRGTKKCENGDKTSAQECHEKRLSGANNAEVAIAIRTKQDKSRRMKTSQRADERTEASSGVQWTK